MLHQCQGLLCQSDDPDGGGMDLMKFELWDSDLTLGLSMGYNITLIDSFSTVAQHEENSASIHRCQYRWGMIVS